mgnify:CR=1 FL=1
MLVVAVIGMIASLKVQSTFKKYSTMPARCGLRANDVARRLLYEGGSSATLSPVSGSLTDHYDPTKNAVGLSESVYNSTSVAALAVAAHEIGHVMQHQEGYTPIKVRNALLPVARIGSTVGPWLVIIGIMMGAFNLASIGAGLYFGILAFQLVTLPVAFNASARAIETIDGQMLLDSDELPGAKKVLRAAAMTYVAALLMSALQLLRFVLIFLGRNNRGGGRD